MPSYCFSGPELRRRRIAAGLRHEHVAVATNRTKESVRAWEVGRANPSAIDIGRLCDVLGCTPADLFPVATKKVAS